MERDCESELSKLNIEQNACIYHFGASVIHGQRSNILRLPPIYLYCIRTISLNHDLDITSILSYEIKRFSNQIIYTRINIDSILNTVETKVNSANVY